LKKRTKKLFLIWVLDGATPAAQWSKSFLLPFSKKEVLASLQLLRCVKSLAMR
jgi:hypothetical protein